MFAIVRVDDNGDETMVRVLDSKPSPVHMILTISEIEKDRVLSLPIDELQRALGMREDVPISETPTDELSRLISMYVLKAMSKYKAIRL